ncbi:hypothetical protein KIPB_004214 [Kipferlia bialata]|uniref:Uncharacterized protein n=1 Tax=Kipferlia bialata TaxID=797122 RepID=A0A9K3GH93_9EUKA|nr:hypothetical protein KIPB_004214 [Kipferlia bialata]|eukprot:g4214.t1
MYYSSIWRDTGGGMTFNYNYALHFNPCGKYVDACTYPEQPPVGMYLSYISITPTYFWGDHNWHMSVTVDTPAAPVNHG